jgi:CBS domain-containing protein
MKRDVLTIDADSTVRQAAIAMKARRVGGVIVTSTGTPVGMLTERDLAFRIIAEGRDPDVTRVREVMSSPLASIEPAASVEDAAALMKRLRIKRLVVVMDGHVRGILTATDIAYAAPDATRSLMEGWVKQRWE